MAGSKAARAGEVATGSLGDGLDTISSRRERADRKWDSWAGDIESGWEEKARTSD